MLCGAGIGPGRLVPDVLEQRFPAPARTEVVLLSCFCALLMRDDAHLLPGMLSSARIALTPSPRGLPGSAEV